jgi:hypothetical protein
VWQGGEVGWSSGGVLTTVQFLRRVAAGLVCEKVERLRQGGEAQAI